jgi:hypothetical protein
VLHSAAVASTEVSLGRDAFGGSESLVSASCGVGRVPAAGIGAGWIVAGDGD